MASTLPAPKLPELNRAALSAQEIERARAVAVKRLAQGGSKDDARLDKAIELVKRELDLYEKAFGKDDPILIKTLSRMSELYWVKGLENLAKPLDARAGELREAQLVSQTPEQTMKQEVKQLRAFLRFEDADEEFEVFKKLHPDKTFVF